jgi:hypothetical protein
MNAGNGSLQAQDVHSIAPTNGAFGVKCLSAYASLPPTSFSGVATLDWWRLCR